MAMDSPSKPRTRWIVSAIMPAQAGTLVKLNYVYADSVRPSIYIRDILEQMKPGHWPNHLTDLTYQTRYKLEPISTPIALPTYAFDLIICLLSRLQMKQIANRIKNEVRGT